MKSNLRDAIDNFNRDHLILEVVDPDGAMKRVATTGGGEWAGPCPLCGGTDRLRAWPERGRAWCRQCKSSGDALAWAVAVSGYARPSDFLRASALLDEERTVPWTKPGAGVYQVPEMPSAGPSRAPHQISGTNTYSRPLTLPVPSDWLLWELEDGFVPLAVIVYSAARVGISEEEVMRAGRILKIKASPAFPAGVCWELDGDDGLV